jgi:hypothetical protein
VTESNCQDDKSSRCSCDKQVNTADALFLRDTAAWLPPLKLPLLNSCSSCRLQDIWAVILATSVGTTLVRVVRKH